MGTVDSTELTLSINPMLEAGRRRLKPWCQTEKELTSGKGFHMF